MVRDQVVGSGLIASAFRDALVPMWATIYAAGVSNSSIKPGDEISRDQSRLRDSLNFGTGPFVYFSTVSVNGGDSHYVYHKRYCENLIKSSGRDYLICRLPIVAGRTSNPHTLLNFLHDRISRGEPFEVWAKARRNVIDVADVVDIVLWLLRSGAKNETVDVAAPQDYYVTQIVEAMSLIVDKPAVCTTHDAKGDHYEIDVRRIRDAPVYFGDDYLTRTLRRYYA